VYENGHLLYDIVQKVYRSLIANRIVSIEENKAMKHKSAAPARAGTEKQQSSTAMLQSGSCTAPREKKFFTILLVK